METYHGFATKRLKSFFSSIPVWTKKKLFMHKMLNDELAAVGTFKAKIVFYKHHLSRTASASYHIHFEEAAIIPIDVVGEWGTTTICYGKGNRVNCLLEFDFPHSLGLLYSVFTYYCGFKVNSDEYQLMGLASYGIPDFAQAREYKKKITEYIVDIKNDRSIFLNIYCFDFTTGITMCLNKKWEQLFGIAKWEQESDLNQPYRNLVYDIQQATEDIVLLMAATARKLTGSCNSVMAVGVALHFSTNGKLLRNKIFDNIWIQPAAGDTGGALGAAYAAWHIVQSEVRTIAFDRDAKQGSYFSLEFV